MSVVIPCFNHGRFLADAIEGALAQTWASTEVVVVLDGCTDDSETVARRYAGVRIVTQDNQGLSRARNAGFRACRGEIVIFLDADDRLAPNAALSAVTALRAHPEAMLAFGRCHLIDERGGPMATTLPVITDDHYVELLRQNFIWTPAMAAIRREALLALGGFRPSFDASGDYDLYLRLALKSRFVAHDAYVAEYRKHDASMSRDPVLMLDTTLAVLREHEPVVAGDARLRVAYKEGLRSWHTFYGEHLVERFRRRLHAGEWMAAIRDAGQLTRLYPRGVWLHLMRKSRVILRGLRDLVGRGRLRGAARP